LPIVHILPFQVRKRTGKQGQPVSCIISSSSVFEASNLLLMGAINYLHSRLSLFKSSHLDPLSCVDNVKQAAANMRFIHSFKYLYSALQGNYLEALNRPACLSHFHNCL